MNRKRLFIFITIFLIACALVVSLFYYLSSQKEENILLLYGNVDVRQVDIGFRVAGIVEKLLFEEGDFVKKGTLVAELDNTPFTSQVAQAKANAQSAKINYENSQKLLERRKELIGVGGISEEDLENTQASHDSLYANVQAMEAAYNIACDNFSYIQAFAPNEGIILTRIREPGSVVNPTDPVYTLSITSPVWIRAYIDESHLGQICYGMQATVHTDTQGMGPYTGKIGFISPIAEFTPKTVETSKLRTDLVYRLRIYVDNPDCFLKQGMPITVKIPLKETSEDG